MKRKLFFTCAAIIVAVIFGACSNAPTQNINTAMSLTTPTAKSVYEFHMKNIDGKDVNLADYKGKVLLIVNVASKCGNTPQYASLEEFYKKHKAKGFVILGFPANNFGSQEPGTDAEIKTFCTANYNVSFPMFSKISVKGDDIHPLYQYLVSATNAPVQWNFQKFLVDKTGKVITSFAPGTPVDSPEVSKAIEALL